MNVQCILSVDPLLDTLEGERTVLTIEVCLCQGLKVYVYTVAKYCDSFCSSCMSLYQRGACIYSTIMKKVTKITFTV